MTALLSLEQLSHLQRAVFVMSEVFAYDFAEVATAVGRSEEDCRRLLLAARQHMAKGRPRVIADREAMRSWSPAFSMCCAVGTSRS